VSDHEFHRDSLRDPRPPRRPFLAIFFEEFLKPRDIAPYRLAKDIGVPLTRILAILACRRAITADTGLRLDPCFGLSEGYSTGLQQDSNSLQQSVESLVGRLPMLKAWRGMSSTERTCPPAAVLLRAEPALPDRARRALDKGLP